MSDGWSDDLRAEHIDTDPRPGFKDELRDIVNAEWHGRDVAGQRDTGRPRWWLLAGAAACVALLIGGLFAFSRDDWERTPATVPEPGAVTTPEIVPAINTEPPATTQPDSTGPPATVEADIVVTDPLSNSLDDWIDPTATPLAAAEIVVIDQGVLDDALVVSDETGALYTQGSPSALGYRYEASVTTDDQAVFDVIVERDMLNDPCGFLDAQNPGTVGDLTGTTPGESVCGQTDDGSTLAVSPADGSNPDTTWTSLQIADALTLVQSDEVPHPDLTATTGTDEPDIVGFAGTLSGARWAITVGTSGTRPMLTYVAGTKSGGFELSQQGLNAGQASPVIDSEIEGVPGYGVIAYGHVEGDAVAVIVTTNDQRTARLPMLPSDGRSAFAVPIPDTVEVETLTFITEDGSVIAVADVPNIPAGLGGAGVIGLVPQP